MLLREAHQAYWKAKAHPRFRSRKAPTQSCYIPKSAIKNSGIYPRISGTGLYFYESLPELPLDSRLVYQYNEWFLSVPHKITTHVAENQGRVVALDPLNGYCDFMFSASSSQLNLSAPVMAIVEAKNENINSGFGQCMAEMVAAQIYNENKGKPIKFIYGCVTTGSIWKFLQLTEKMIRLDEKEYYLDQIPKILGLFVESVSYYCE